MSRTDVHRPWLVQLADQHNRHLLYRYQMWPWETGLTSYRNLSCGCRGCTGHHARRTDRRRDRARWRRTAQALRGTSCRDDDEVGRKTRRSW